MKRKKSKQKKYEWQWVAILILAVLIIAAFFFRNREETPAITTGVETTSSVNLPNLAEQNYGNPIFWVYIYEANRDKLTSPVNIPAEVHLIIPDLLQYNIDPTDSNEIAKARALSNMILRKIK